MKDICINQYDSSVNLALIGEMLGSAGVNIEGLCFTTFDGQGIIHFAVEDAITARHVLEESGIKITEMSEVFVLHKDKKRVTGKSGSFGGICRMFEEHGIKIYFGYPAENNRFIFGVDNAKKAQELLG